VSKVKAAAEPQMPPLDAPRCAADVLGWHVILKDITDPAIVNGESGVVESFIGHSIAMGVKSLVGKAARV